MNLHPVCRVPVRGLRLVASLLAISLSCHSHDLLDIVQSTPDPAFEAGRKVVDESAETEEAKRTLRAILQADHRWTKSVVAVCFGPASAVTQRKKLLVKIIEAGKQWVSGTGLAFDFGGKTNDPAEVYVCGERSKYDIRVTPESNNQYLSLIGNNSSLANLPAIPGFSMSLGFPPGWEDNDDLAAP